MSATNQSPFERVISIPRAQAEAIGLECPAGELCAVWPASKAAELLQWTLAVQERFSPSTLTGLVGMERTYTIGRMRAAATYTSQVLKRIAPFLPPPEETSLVVTGAEQYLADK